MAAPSRRMVIGTMFVVLLAIVGWGYYHSLVPAIHQDHDHPLENLAAGGFLRVEAVEGRRRNLVGRPGRVLILHWFQPNSATTASELPSLVDYSGSVADDPGIEVLLIATSGTRESVRDWARGHRIPTRPLYVDRNGETAQLIGVRRTPETLIYDPEGHLAHQARGPMDWTAPTLRQAIEGFKPGDGEHQH